MLDRFSLMNGHRPSTRRQCRVVVFPGHDPSSVPKGFLRGSRRTSDPDRRLAAPTTELERQGEQECAEDNRVRSDQPHQGQRAGSWNEHRQHAERDRQDAVQRQTGLTRDPAAESDGRHDLQHAGHDRPRRDHVEQREPGKARHRECDDTRGNADESLEKQCPPRLVVSAASDGGDDVEDALHEGVAAEEQDQGGQRDARPDERQDAEDDRGDTAKGQSPPVPCKRAEIHVMVSSPLRRYRPRSPIPPPAQQASPHQADLTLPSHPSYSYSRCWTHTGSWVAPRISARISNNGTTWAKSADRSEGDPSRAGIKSGAVIASRSPAGWPLQPMGPRATLPAKCTEVAPRLTGFMSKKTWRRDARGR